ncbi:MAG: acireductone synthase [Bacteroidota bacterium]
MTQFILMDIEGTTTSIAFVHEVLFPYASQHLEAFVKEHQTDKKVQAELDAVKATVLSERGVEIDNAMAIQKLLDWIAADRKHTALKTLQGYLWRFGYESGEYQGHIYPDVVPAMLRWKAAGVKMGIYSSGSVEAQQLLFGHSEAGDLRPYLSAYFDTKIGHKREVESYQTIQRQLNIPASSILFLSDIEAELDAARTAGFQTIQLVRPGTAASTKHPTVTSFAELPR